MRSHRCVVLFILCSVAIKPLFASFIGGLFSTLTGGGGNKNEPRPQEQNQGFMHNNPTEQFNQHIAEERFMKPPLNPAYAAQLKLLSTLPLSQRLAYLKAGLLRTGAKILQEKGSNLLQNSHKLTHQANSLYTTRPPPPPAPTRQPGSFQQGPGLGGIIPRGRPTSGQLQQTLRPGVVVNENHVDSGLIRLTDPGLTNPGLSSQGLTNPGLSSQGLTNQVLNSQGFNMQGSNNQGFNNQVLINPGLLNQGLGTPQPIRLSTPNSKAALTFSSLQDMITKQRLLSQQQRLQEINRGPAVVRGQSASQVRVPFNQQNSAQQSLAQPSTCNERLGQLVGDIFIGHEMIPQVLDLPPDSPLELTYRTVRTFPGMRLTAEATRFKPMIHWPSEQGVLYTIVISNLDINSRKNRTLSEFWHWFVANVPGNSIDDGQEIFQLLHPLVLPEGSGDHRFGYFVMKQPSFLDYKDEGGPTDSCSPLMSAGRGPFRSTKDFMKKYGLRLVAATFLIIDSSPASVEIACEWQACMGGEVFLKDLDCELIPPRQQLFNNKR